MPKEKLFEGEESEDEEVSFKFDNQYAKRYDNWREKEELHKLEQKYGDKPLNSDGSTSSDSEDESDEPPEVSEEVETQFLKTLSLLKTKDPRIYDPNYKFFDEANEDKEKVEEKEEEKIKPKKEVNSLAAAFAESDDDDDDKEIFKVEKKAPEPAKKEVKLREYLSGEAPNLGIDPAVERELAPLRELWSDPRINEGEAFLRDYILQKKYLDPDEQGVGDQVRDDEGLEADERTVEQQRLFERAYNFRYEEPDQEYLKRYPRTLNSIRPKDDRRAKKRAEIRTRKDEEKKRKMEEIARLKAFKLKEIQEKIARIKEVTGNEELAFKDEDLEGDFDPEEHDRRMRAIFDQHYYQGQDDRKPEFPDLDEELEIENWEKYELEHGGADDELNPQAGEAPHCEDDDFNMDADYDPKKARTTLLEEIQETLGKKRRNRKKKSKLAKLLEADKPKYVPTVTDRSFNQYMEEYYKIDCEDVIGGDLPTRFKYRDVVPNSFGLSVEEILLADDKELNQWASLKKAVRIRPENVERSELNTYRLKAQDHQLKRKMLPSLFKDIPEEPEIVVPIETVAKKKKKNKHNKDETKQNNDLISPNKTETNVPDHNDQIALDQTSQNDLPEAEVTKKLKKKGKHKISEDTLIENYSNVNSFKDDNSIENVILENGAVENKKRKKKNKRKNNEDVTMENDSKDHSNVGDSLIANTTESKVVETKRQKKNRKRKHSEANAIENDSKNVSNMTDHSISNTLPSITVEAKKSKKKRKAKLNNNNSHENHSNANINKGETAVTVNTGEAQPSKKKKRWQKRAEKLQKLKEMEMQNEINTETSQGQSNKLTVQSESNLPKPNRENTITQTKLTKTQEKINKHKSLLKELLQKQSIKTKSNEGPSKSDGFTVPNTNKNKRKRLNSDSLPKRPFMKKGKLFKQKGKGAAGGSKVDENPLGQLSDERLKAYGLNPKKYRGFLKYKKF